MRGLFLKLYKQCFPCFLLNDNIKTFIKFLTGTAFFVEYMYYVEFDIAGTHSKGVNFWHNNSQQSSYELLKQWAGFLKNHLLK